MKLRSKDGHWRVDLIRLSDTGTNRDGEWIRITRRGYFVAEVRTVEELARYVDPAELEEALLAGSNLLVPMASVAGAAPRPGLDALTRAA